MAIFFLEHITISLFILTSLCGGHQGGRLLPSLSGCILRFSGRPWPSPFSHFFPLGDRLSLLSSCHWMIYPLGKSFSQINISYCLVACCSIGFENPWDTSQAVEAALVLILRCRWTWKQIRKPVYSQSREFQAGTKQSVPPVSTYRALWVKLCEALLQSRLNRIVGGRQPPSFPKGEMQQPLMRNTAAPPLRDPPVASCHSSPCPLPASACRVQWGWGPDCSLPSSIVLAGGLV